MTDDKTLFCWDEISSGYSYVNEQLLKKLEDDFCIDWVKDGKITKSDDNILIRKDDLPSIRITIDRKEEKAFLEISDVPFYELKVKMKDEKLCLYKIKKAYVLIKVKPGYEEEFCIMMIAFKGLCNRASESKKLAKLDDVFSVLGPYDFILELSGGGNDEEKRGKEMNKTLSKIRENLGGYIYETCTLTQFEVSRILGKEGKEYLGRAESFKKYVEPKDFNNFFEKLKSKKDIDGLGNPCDVKDIKLKKDVNLLIKVKPPYTEEFLLKIIIFKNICADRARNLAKIDKVCLLAGPFDFLLKIKGEDKEIFKTILNIREFLGDCINETITFDKFKIPITKEKLEKHFERILGEKNLVRLPDKTDEKIPKESLEPDKIIDLIDIYNAETTSLKNLLKGAKTFFETWELNKQICKLSNRVYELEKRIK